MGFKFNPLMPGDLLDKHCLDEWYLLKSNLRINNKFEKIFEEELLVSIWCRFLLEISSEKKEDFLREKSPKD